MHKYPDSSRILVKDKNSNKVVTSKIVNQISTFKKASEKEV